MLADIEAGRGGTVITKDPSRLGRDYLKTGEYIEIVFPHYDVRYIAINDGVDTAKSENEMMAFKNIFNDWYARDCSKKIRAVFKAIISQQTFDLVQELRKNKRRLQRKAEVNPFAGMVYCADCGEKMYLSSDRTNVPNRSICAARLMQRTHINAPFTTSERVC